VKKTANGFLVPAKKIRAAISVVRRNSKRLKAILNENRPSIQKKRRRIKAESNEENMQPGIWAARLARKLASINTNREEGIF
jgi:hypothetical protein